MTLVSLLLYFTLSLSSLSSIVSVNGQLWIGGATSANTFGTYSNSSTNNIKNSPGSRYQASSWHDQSNGLVWIFGGNGYPLQPNPSGLMSDLWVYNISSQVWRWVTGNYTTANGGGTYGNLHGPGQPGARQGAATWIDSSGRLWMFGGRGHDSNATLGYLSDLWCYDDSVGHWIWVGGSSSSNTAGEYQGEVLFPGGRSASSYWIDSENQFWLFGGFGIANASITGFLNDLWVYNSEQQEWKWVNGGEVVNLPVVVNTSMPLLSCPGGRYAATFWKDDKDNIFWLFGGYGLSRDGASGHLNDLWKYNVSSSIWSFISGSIDRNKLGDYSSTNSAVPGARMAASGWYDSSESSGVLWLFGGSGLALDPFEPGYLNDVWTYNISMGKWLWVGGVQDTDVNGIYNSNDNRIGMPGSRYYANSWKDVDGQLWLFGGVGNAASTKGQLNDIWIVAKWNYCALKKVNCGLHASCKHTVQGWYCECDSGFIGDGNTCTSGNVSTTTTRQDTTGSFLNNTNNINSNKFVLEPGHIIGASWVAAILILSSIVGFLFVKYKRGGCKHPEGDNNNKQQASVVSIA